jgi:tetratricopeptide (TPR) repeat protein
MLYVSGRTVDSLERLREAVAILEELNAASSAGAEIQGRLAVTYDALASVLRLGKPVAGLVPDLKAALDMQRKANALEAALAATAASDTGLQRQLLVGIMNLGEILEQLGDRTAARDQYRQGVDMSGQMAQADPANLQAQKDVAWASTRLGQLLARSGETDEAFVLLRHAGRTLVPVVAANPADVNTRSHAAGITEGLAHAHLALGSNRRLRRSTRLSHWREARAGFQDAYAFWTEMRDKGVTTGADLARPDALAREIAKCDAALGTLATKG